MGHGKESRPHSRRLAPRLERHRWDAIAFSLRDAGLFFPRKQCVLQIAEVGSTAEDELQMSVEILAVCRCVGPWDKGSVGMKDGNRLDWVLTVGEGHVREEAGTRDVVSEVREAGVRRMSLEVVTLGDLLR